jgi:peptidoglycan/LPS O-acetylase OafA/YrhL
MKGDVLSILDQITENPKNNYLKNDSSFLIDVIRVLACEMVVCSHLFHIYNNYFGLSTDKPNFSLMDISLGCIGVILFFIVSGIVISNSLIKKINNDKSYGFVNFFIDRFCRIYSGLVPCLIFIFLCGIAIRNINSSYFYKLEEGNLSVSAFLGSLFMLQRLKFFGTSMPSFGSILWTLNIEWWLYLLFGWLVFNLMRKTKVTAFFIAPMLLFAYHPTFMFLVSYDENLPLVWFMGVAATIIYINSGIELWDRRLDYAILAILMLIIGRLYIIYIYDKNFFDITLELLLTLLTIILMAKLKNTNLFEKTRIKNGIKFMGKYCFTLYLTHYVIENLIFCIYVTFNLKYSLALVFIIAILISNIIAIIIAYPTEMRYKELANLFHGLVKQKYTRENYILIDSDKGKT